MASFRQPLIQCYRRCIRSFSTPTGKEKSSSTNQHFVRPIDRFWLKFTRTLPGNEIGKEVSHAMMLRAIERRRIATNLSIMLAGVLVAFFTLRASQTKRRAVLDDLINE